MKKILMSIITISIVLILSKFYLSNYKIEYKINNYNIKETYKVFLKDFTYANPGEQKVSKIMQLIKDFYDDDEIIIPEY